MWITSVPPMPSVISMPVACFHNWRVASGKASPADTGCWRLLRSCCPAIVAIWRYMVGAV
jgi:hypothetical protein